MAAWGCRCCRARSVHALPRLAAGRADCTAVWAAHAQAAQSMLSEHWSRHCREVASSSGYPSGTASRSEQLDLMKMELRCAGGDRAAVLAAWMGPLCSTKPGGSGGIWWRETIWIQWKVRWQRASCLAWPGITCIWLLAGGIMQQGRQRGIMQGALCQLMCVIAWVLVMDPTMYGLGC